MIDGTRLSFSQGVRVTGVIIFPFPHLWFLSYESACRLITSNILSEPRYKFFWFPYSEAGTVKFCHCIGGQFYDDRYLLALIKRNEIGRLAPSDMFVEFITPNTQAAFHVLIMFTNTCHQYYASITTLNKLHNCPFCR